MMTSPAWFHYRRPAALAASIAFLSSSIETCSKEQPRLGKQDFQRLRDVVLLVNMQAGNVEGTGQCEKIVVIGQGWFHYNVYQKITAAIDGPCLNAGYPATRFSGAVAEDTDDGRYLAGLKICAPIAAGMPKPIVPSRWR